MLRFLKKKKEPPTKEFLEYKNGQVIPVETIKDENNRIESNQKISRFNITRLKEYVKKRTEEPHKLIRLLLYIFIGFIVLLILLDLLKWLYPSDANPESSYDNQYEEYLMDQSLPSNNTESPIGDDKNTKPNSSVEYSTALQWAELVKVTEKTNNELTELTMKDIELYYLYRNKGINRLALESKLGRNLERKRETVNRFTFYENGFKELDFEDLYKKTNNRNEASLNFTEDLISMITQYQKNIHTSIDLYIQQDNELADEQDLLITLYLKNNNTNYFYDKQQGKILY